MWKRSRDLARRARDRRLRHVLVEPRGDSVRSGGARRFGLITTNSLTMVFNRSLVEAHCSADPPLNIAFAIADHPWVDSAEGAAARIAMTIGRRESLMGRVLKVTREHEVGFGEVAVDLSERDGIVHADLRTGANLAAAERLTANMGLSFMGMIPLGAGFWIDEPTAVRLGLGAVPGLDQHIRRYVNGKDLVGTPRGVLALDFFGMQEQEVRSRFPKTYQWIFDRVRPVRDKDNRESYPALWWIYAESPDRSFGLPRADSDRYIVTVETAKHRVFAFLDAAFVPDQKRSSSSHATTHCTRRSVHPVHVHWALATVARWKIGPATTRHAASRPSPSPPTTPASPPPSPSASAASPNNSTPTARRARPRTNRSR